jgi:hypothetical protein
MKVNEDTPMPTVDDQPKQDAPSVQLKSESNEMLKDSVLEYFASNKITLPTDVQSHLLEAFEDIDFQNVSDDTINIYYKEDREEFEKDYNVFKEAIIDINGTSHVETCDSYTYYGSVNIGFAESIKLVSGSTTINELESIPMETPTSITDTDQYVVCVLEKTTADCSYDQTKRSVVVKTYLYIYCPLSGEGIDN